MHYFFITTMILWKETITYLMCFTYSVPRISVLLFQETCFEERHDLSLQAWWQQSLDVRTKTRVPPQTSTKLHLNHELFVRCSARLLHFLPPFVDVNSDTVVVVTRASEPWLNSSNPTPSGVGREDDSGEIRVEKHRCPRMDGVPWWCWTRTEDCVFIRL